MAIPPVPGKKLTRQHSASKRAPAHSAKARPVAKKVPVEPPPAPAKKVPKHHPHRGLHRLLIGLNIFVGLCVITAAVGYGYIKFRLGQLDKISFGCNVLRNCGDDDPGKPMNVLLVGSDTRSFVKNKSDTAQFGNANEVGGERTDTMMVLHVDPTAEKASILSIPRDLWVPIAGMGYRERINTAYGIETSGKHAVTTGRSTATTTNALGVTGTTSSTPIKDGPERLIATIRQSLGIEIDHYIEVNFSGFRSIVNAIGGVTVPFPAPARDKFSGLDVKTAGCVSLGGDQALGYVRSRHFQYYESGRWRSDPTGDIGRIQRQQDFIRRVLRKAISKGIRNPIKLNALIGAGVNNVKLDSALSTKDIARLGKRFKSLEPEAVDMLTLPTDGFRTPAGASVLKLRDTEARTIINRFNGVGQAPTTPNGPVPKIPPATVRVLVLNGTGVNGQAGQVQRQLTTAGFGTGGIGDAHTYSNPVTTIRYGAGQLQKAQLLQAYIVGGAKLVLDNTLKGGDIQLIVGAGFGGVRTSLNSTASSVPPTTVTTTGAAANPRGAAALAC